MENHIEKSENCKFDIRVDYTKSLKKRYQRMKYQSF